MGIPEKTESVKIAEKQHELAQSIEDSKAKVAYVAPYTTYGGVYPYVHNVAHVVAKREADSESNPEPYVTYNGLYGAAYNPFATTYGAPYKTVVSGYPYTTSVSGYHAPALKQVVNAGVYSQVPAVLPTAVKYVDPHHTEGMTADGVPEKTDSVKIAEKQHELAQTIEESKAKVAYVAPYTTYAGVYPYVHNVAHVVAKREADSEAAPEPYVTYNNLYGAAYNPLVNTYATPYNTAVAGFPYTTASVSGYHYQQPYVAPVVYRGKRDADSQYYSPYAYNTYNYAPYRYNYAPYAAYTNGYYY